MENGIMLVQLIGFGLILYSGGTLLQSWLAEPEPWQVMAERNVERHERRQALADHASKPIHVDYQAPLRHGAFLRDIGANALANGWLSDLLRPLEEQLAA